MLYSVLAAFALDEPIYTKEMPWPVISRPAIRYSLYGLLPLAFFFGLWRTVVLRWVCDDAFISFRYAQNLVRGHGLVFNVGEKVEGYTNFLWTILMAGGLKLGLDPVVFSWVLGIAAHAGTVLVVGWLSWRLFRDRGSDGGWFMPLAALVLLFHHDQQTWATGGLETSALTLLVAGGFVTLVLAERRRSYVLAGVLMALAALTRPDGLIFSVMGVAGLLVAGRSERRQIVFFLLPLLIIFVPYWLLRWQYYGYPFPNTYYAKSADQSYFTQGWLYLWLYVKTYYVLMLLPAVAGVGGWLLWRKQLDGRRARALLLSLLMTMAYAAYVVKVGGDFMFARFLVPLTPLVFAAFEIVLGALVKRPVRRAAATILMVALVVLRWDQLGPDRGYAGIADERHFYPAEKIAAVRETGERLQTVLDDTGAVVGYFGGHAMFVYYADVDLAIECDAGLTDTFVAHQPLTVRGRVGHEKKAPLAYLVSRKTNFLFKGSPPNSTHWDQMRGIDLGGYRAFILLFENSVMDRLARHDDVEFFDVRLLIDQYIERLDHLPDDELQRDYGFLKAYYFDVNDDPTRQRPFLERLR